jgi:hypothetical protein
MAVLKFSIQTGSIKSNHAPSLVAFTTITPVLKFSVHTGQVMLRRRLTLTRPYKPARSVAPQSTASKKRSRKRKATAATDDGPSGYRA